MGSEHLYTSAGRRVGLSPLVSEADEDLHPRPTAGAAQPRSLSRPPPLSPSTLSVRRHRVLAGTSSLLDIQHTPAQLFVRRSCMTRSSTACTCAPNRNSLPSLISHPFSSDFLHTIRKLIVTRTRAQGKVNSSMLYQLVPVDLLIHTGRAPTQAGRLQDIEVLAEFVECDDGSVYEWDALSWWILAEVALQLVNR